MNTAKQSSWMAPFTVTGPGFAARVLLLVMLASLSATLGAATKVYRTVDADGNVVFTDVPPARSAESIDVNAPNSFNPEIPTPAQPSSDERPVWTSEEDDEEEFKVFSYEGLRIDTPSPGGTVRDNAGNLQIVVNVPAGLAPGHRLQILMDDNVVHDGTDTDVALTNVDRGTHTLVATVLNQSGEPVISSEPSLFHMHRYSVLTAPNRGVKPPPTAPQAPPPPPTKPPFAPPPP